MELAAKKRWATAVIATLVLVGLALAVLQTLRTELPDHLYLQRRGARLSGESDPGWTRDFTEAYLEGEQFSDDDVARLLSFPTLERISLKGSSVTDRGVATLTQLPRLMRLDLSETSVTRDGLRSIARCRKLWELDLSHCLRLELSDLRMLADAQRLTAVIMEPRDAPPELVLDLVQLLGDRFPYSPAEAFDTPDWIRLQSVVGNGPWHIQVKIETFRLDHQPGTGMQSVQSTLAKLPFRQLVTRFFVSGAWPDSGAERLQFLPALFTSLEQFYQDTVTDGDLRALSRCPGLRTIHTGHTQHPLDVDTYASLGNVSIEPTPSSVTDEGLAALTRLTSLEQLSLSSSKIAGPGLEAIGRIHSLRYLSLRVPNADARFIATWRGLQNLRHLELEIARVDGAELAPLGELSQLEQLNLLETDLSCAELGWVRTELNMQPVFQTQIGWWRK